MTDFSKIENKTSADDGYEESLAESLSLELQRDSRRYSADFES